MRNYNVALHDPQFHSWAAHRLFSASGRPRAIKVEVCGYTATVCAGIASKADARHVCDQLPAIASECFGAIERMAFHGARPEQGT